MVAVWEKPGTAVARVSDRSIIGHDCAGEAGKGRFARTHARRHARTALAHLGLRSRTGRALGGGIACGKWPCHDFPLLTVCE